jgi:hypothetical protein
MAGDESGGGNQILFSCKEDIPIQLHTEINDKSQAYQRKKKTDDKGGSSK